MVSPRVDPDGSAPANSREPTFTPPTASPFFWRPTSSRTTGGWPRSTPPPRFPSHWADGNTPKPELAAGRSKTKRAKFGPSVIPPFRRFSCKPGGKLQRGIDGLRKLNRPADCKMDCPERQTPCYESCFNPGRLPHLSAMPAHLSILILSVFCYFYRFFTPPILFVS